MHSKFVNGITQNPVKDINIFAMKSNMILELNTYCHVNNSIFKSGTYENASILSGANIDEV